MTRYNEFRYSLANIFDLPGFVMTPQVQRVCDFCEAVRQTNTVGILSGLPGVGKTWAVQHKAQTEPEPEQFRTSPVLYIGADVKADVRGFLTTLLNGLGPDYRAPVGDMARLACCWIHRRLTELVIVDNAHWLDKTSLEMLADIHDRTRCAFILVGPEELSAKLRRHRGLENRVSISLEMLPLSYDELFAFLQRWTQRQEALPPPSGFHWHHYIMEHQHEPEIVKEIYRVTLGNLRHAQQFMDQAARVTMINRQYCIQLETAQVVAVLMRTGRL